MNSPGEMKRAQPRLFLGSSVEGLPIGNAVRSHLADAAMITMWNEGFFALGSTFIETLVNQLPTFDFAVLILTPDDVVTSRSAEAFSPRDNLIFELGLFTAGLGRSRTFIVTDRCIKRPSDLAGVSTATYDAPDVGESVDSALDPACKSIRLAIEDLGFSEAKTAKKITQLQARQSHIESNVKALQIIVRGLLSDWEFDKLKGLADSQPFQVWFNDKMLDELYRLRALGYINPKPGHNLSSIRERRGKAEQFDLKQYVQITPSGLDYVRLREDTATRQTLHSLAMIRLRNQLFNCFIPVAQSST